MYPTGGSRADQKWIAVAERRLRELRTGKVDAVPAGDVFEKALERFS